MRLSSQKSAPNCWLDAPSWGKIPLVATALGYGMNVVSKEGEARTKKTFYPWVRTSGAWYIQVEHASRYERDLVHTWLLFYISRISNPRLTPLQPISVTVPARDFHKIGYPKSSVLFGDDYGKDRYQSVITLTSASDPDTTEFNSSRFVSASSDFHALFFNPAGIQLGSTPPPRDTSSGGVYDVPGNVR